MCLARAGCQGPEQSLLTVWGPQHAGDPGGPHARWLSEARQLADPGPPGLSWKQCPSPRLHVYILEQRDVSWT